MSILNSNVITTLFAKLINYKTIYYNVDPRSEDYIRLR